MSGTVVVFVICINVSCDKKKGLKSRKFFLQVSYHVLSRNNILIQGKIHLRFFLFLVNWIHIAYITININHLLWKNMDNMSSTQDDSQDAIYLPEISNLLRKSRKNYLYGLTKRGEKNWPKNFR